MPKCQGGPAAGAPEGDLGPDEWPKGCCGYAFNLMRPVRPGLRASVLYPLIGGVLARPLPCNRATPTLTLAYHNT